MFRGLALKRYLRKAYQTREPFILFTDAGDAVAVFPQRPSDLGLELAALESVDSLLQDETDSHN